MLPFVQPTSSSYIKVIGVGGGGGNAVNYMHRNGIKGVDFIICNTDKKALDSSNVPNKIAIGKQGLGAGNKPERAKKAAEESADEIREMLSHNTQMLFITAGMGGGTGTGAAPVIAQIAKSIDLEDEDTPKILVVAIVTTPFTYEGRPRMRQALEGIEELKKHVDATIVINNDKLRSFGDFKLSKAFETANDILHTACKGIAEIITGEGMVNIDFQDVNTVIANSGTALMGIGRAKGESRAQKAIEAATTSSLLNDSNIEGSRNVLLYFSYSHEHEMTMDEMTEVTNYLNELINNEENQVIWGSGYNDELDEELEITLIATGYHAKGEARTDAASTNSRQEKTEKKIALGEREEAKSRQSTDIIDNATQPAPEMKITQELEPQQIKKEAAEKTSSREEEAKTPRKVIVLTPLDETPTRQTQSDIQQQYEPYEIEKNTAEVQKMPERAADVERMSAAAQQPEVDEKESIPNQDELYVQRTAVSLKEREEKLKRWLNMLKNDPNAPGTFAKKKPHELMNEEGANDIPTPMEESRNAQTASNGFLFSGID